MGLASMGLARHFTVITTIMLILYIDGDTIVFIIIIITMIAWARLCGGIWIVCR